MLRITVLSTIVGLAQGAANATSAAPSPSATGVAVKCSDICGSVDEGGTKN